MRRRGNACLARMALNSRDPTLRRRQQDGFRLNPMRAAITHWQITKWIVGSAVLIALICSASIIVQSRVFPPPDRPAMEEVSLLGCSEDYGDYKATVEVNNGTNKARHYTVSVDFL